MNTKTINISMPAELIKKIDERSKQTGSNRSDFIRQAVRKQVSVLEQWETAAKVLRADYAGRQLSEEEVADIVREYRNKQPKSA